MNLGEILDTIARTIRRFVVMSDESNTAVTLWAFLTYTFNSFGICPFLGILSPEKKMRQNHVVGHRVDAGYTATAGE